MAFFASNTNALIDMENIVNFKDVEKALLEIQSQRVILDSDVARLYGVNTMRVNEAVKNNPDKFPTGYIIELTKDEKNEAQKRGFTCSPPS